VPNAPRSPGWRSEEVTLISKVHLLIERTIAEAKCITQFTHGLADSLSHYERPVVDAAILAAAPRTTMSFGAAPRLSLMNA
jgi:hypothetical protein